MNGVADADLIGRVNNAICVLLDAEGISDLLQQSHLITPADFPNPVRAGMACIEQQIKTALVILTGESSE